MAQFDLHVATEADFPVELETQLVAMGLEPDNLLDRHVSFYGKVQYSACPLIGLHLTKKYTSTPVAETKHKIEQELYCVEALLKKHRTVGYAHGEVTHDEYDVTIRGEGPFNEHLPWPVKPFVPAISSSNKKWDIHIAIPIDQCSDKLQQILEASGMYSIDLLKVRDGRERVFRVFTIQGTSSPADGQCLFAVLRNWFSQSNAPYVEMKQETYVGMVRVGEPLIVPPTIEQVDYIEVFAVNEAR